MSEVIQDIITKNEEDVLQAFLASTRKITTSARMGMFTISLVMGGYIQREEGETVTSVLETLAMVDEAIATLDIFVAFGDAMFVSEEVDLICTSRTVHVAYRDALSAYADFLAKVITEEGNDGKSTSVPDADSGNTGHPTL